MEPKLDKIFLLKVETKLQTLSLKSFIDRPENFQDYTKRKLSGIVL